MSEREPAALVLALDFPAAAPALRLAGSVRGIVPWVKVGMELFSAEGPSMVHALKELGFSVMLDLKLYDIPNTVQGAVRAAARLGADMLTLHVLGGERMIRAAVDAALGSQHGILLFGVTVLTSMEPTEFFAASAQRSAKTLANVTKKLALHARDWGLDGVVCSGHEVRRLRKATGLRCLTPGIRPMQAAHYDQRRTVSPEGAVRAGSDYLVVGRPITAAPDPAQAAKEILRGMQNAYHKPSPPVL